MLWIWHLLDWCWCFSSRFYGFERIDSEAVRSLNSISGYDILDLRKDFHSHPGYSQADDYASGKKSYGDMQIAGKILNVFKENNVNVKNYPRFFILRPFNKIPYEAYRFEYNQFNNRFNSKRVRRGEDF